MDVHLADHSPVHGLCRRGNGPRPLNLRRRLLAVGLAVLAAVMLGAAPAAAAPDNSGTDFWVGFMTNYIGGAEKSLFITGDEATTGTVQVPGLAFSENFTVTPGMVTTVTLPAGAEMAVGEGKQDVGVRVTAASEVSVYGLSRIRFTTDAYLALPVDVLASEYTVMAWGPRLGGQSELAFVGTQDGTTATITPAVATQGGHAAGTPYDVTLDAGEMYQVQAAAGGEDLTGTTIASTADVAVFGGHQCANIPDDTTRACDHVVEQMTPDETWGTSFLTVPLKTRQNGDTFKFLATEDATEVEVNGTAVATLDAGQQHQQIIDGQASITASDPILVSQFSNGTTFDGVTADPFMMLIPPFEQFQAGYTVTTPASGFAQNFVNLVVPDGAVGSVEVDGTAVPAAEFTPIGSSGFQGAQVDLEVGSHTITGNGQPFGAFVYGFDSADSYGYAGGLSLAPIARVETVALSPATATHVVNTRQCVTATVTDTSDDRVPGVRVDFVVSGANAATASVTGDREGEAQFCYTGTNTGNDTITGSVGAVSGTATKRWVVSPPAPTVTVPADGARTGESTVSLAGRAGQADGDLPEVTVSVRSAGGFGRELAVTVDAEGRWNTSLEGLTSDDYEVVVRQTDEDGNVGESEPSTFTVDRLPPEPVIDRPFDGAVIADAEPTIGGTAGTQTGDEEEVVIEVERVVGEGLERAESIKVAVRDGSWSVDSPTLTDGTYEVRVRQSDDVGNEGTSPARRFTVDTQAPTPTISEPGEASTVGRRPALRGAAGRQVGDADEVRVRLSSGDEPSGTLLLLRAVAVTSEGWSTEPPQDLDDGTYTVEVAQSDYAGNVGTDTTTFVVQDLPPEADLELEPTTGELPLRVTATVAGEDPEGAPTTFELDWGDGASPVRGELPLDGPVVHEYRRAGEFTVALTVSDGSRETVVNRTVDADLAEDLAPAAGDDRVVLAGEPVRFDGRPSRPAVGIEEYRWDFGDGATARGAQVERTYSQPGEYTATLEIRADGRSRSDNARVTVVDPAAQALAVTVGSDEGVLSGASVLVMLPDGRRVQGTTDGRGVALLRGLPDGTHKVYAYQQGHRPAVATATVAQGRGELSIRLQAGEIAATSLESRRLTRDEIVALGIDPDAPENQRVYEFVTVLAVGADTDVQVSGRVNGSGFVGTPRGFSCDGRTCTGSAGGSTIDITAGGGRVPTLQSLVIPGRATFLKEFYEVSLIVQNLAEPEFVFTDGTATLDLPGGLSLAPTSQPQALSTELPDVPGGGSASATWIIRGDQEGSYDFSARYDATLRPFDEAFSVVAELAEPLKVWGGSALEMILDVDDSASARFPYRVRVGLENVADVPVYNPGVELLEDGRENYIYQPRQQLRHATDQVAPGETWWTPYYVLVPSASGDIDLERSFVRKIAGDEALDARIVEHPPRYTAETAPELEARTRDDRVVLEWEAVPGATGYAIFSTPDEDTAFSAQPVPARFLGETKAVVDADSEDSQRFYAVSPLVDGRPDMQHPMVQRGAPPDQPFPSAAVQAATPCQVDPPVLQIEAEDPDFELVRLQIRREGSSELLVDEAIGGLTYSDLRVIAEQTPITVAVRVGNREGQWSSWRSIELGQCDYVALGDSYSSGEGALDDDGNVGDGNDKIGYEANTDIEGQNECHRARNAWPRLLDERLPDLTMQPGGFVACSGAVTANVTDGGIGKGAWGEEAQVEAVSGRTDIATISIGGNDAKFGDALTTCILENFFGGRLTPVCKLTLALNIRPAIDETGPKVREVLRDVRDRLPSSGRLLVLRYPPIFPAASLTCGSVSPTDVTWLHYEQRRFNDILARVVADLEAEGGGKDRASVELIDPPSQFFSHTACDADRWINNVEIPDRVHSFHPNAEGQRQLAGAARAAIEDPARQPAMVGPGETVLRSIDVRGALERLTIAARWPGSTVRVSLVSPSGRQIDATTNAGDVERTATGVSESYSIRRPEPGRWTVRLFGQDVDADGEPTRLNTVQVPVTEVRPLALFEPPPADLVAPARIDLDATNSVAPEGEIAEWRWELGDGATARGSRVSHEYRNAGVYTLKLTVVDDQGRSDTTAVDVVVKEPPADESPSDDDPQPDDDTETAQPPQAQPSVPQRPTPQTPAPWPAQPGQASPPVEGDPGYLYAAKMRVARARVLREDRELDVFAPITSRASGDEVDVEFFAAQRRENFTAEVTSGDAELDRIRFREAIPREQARLGTGIITLRYPGNAVTRPQEVRLRAARNQADLEVDEISLQGDRLSAAGVLTDKAEGVVRLELSYLVVAGQPQVFKTNVKIEDGRWSVENVQVPPEIAQTGAYVSVLFTGYFERRIRGEMVSYQILPGQTRRP